MQVSKLLKNISNQSPQHQPILLRLAVVGLEGLAHPPPKHQLGTEEEFAARYPFLQNARDRSLFLGFAAKIMLYQPPALLPRVMPAAAQNPSEACHWLLPLSIGCTGDICIVYAAQHICACAHVLLYTRVVHMCCLCTHVAFMSCFTHVIASQARPYAWARSRLFEFDF